MVLGLGFHRKTQRKLKASCDELIETSVRMQVGAFMQFVSLAALTLSSGPDEGTYQRLRESLESARALHGKILRERVGLELLPRLRRDIAWAEELLRNAPEPLF